MYSELHVTKQGRNRWKILEDWTTPYGVIPAGATVDGASVPRALWWVMHPSGILFEASVVHDYLYYNGIKSKPYADTALQTVAEHYGATKIESKLAYLAVRLFGRGNYK